MRDVTFVSTHLWFFAYLIDVVWSSLTEVWLYGEGLTAQAFTHTVHLAAIGNGVVIVLMYWLVAALLRSDKWLREPSLERFFYATVTVLGVGFLIELGLVGLGGPWSYTGVLQSVLGYVVVFLCSLSLTYQSLFSEPLLN